MFFQSVIKKKQGILTTVSPRYDSRATKKQIFVNNFANNQQQNLQQNILSINRSKSSKQLNNGNFLSLHLKHPILNKQKTNYRSVALFQNQQQSSQPKEENNLRNGKQLCQKHRKNYQPRQLQTNNFFDSNEYELKNLKKTNSNKILLTSRQFNPDSSGFNSYQSSNLKQTHNSAYQSVKNFQLTNSIRQKSCTENAVLSPFCLQKQMNEYYQEQTTKMTHMDTDSIQLRATIKNLQRQIRCADQQRQIDKGKILQYSITMDKLKFQNDCLKKSVYNSKQNIDSKGRDKQRNQLLEIKKILKQQVQNKQQLIKQRQNILSELNQALITHEGQKNRWESQRKIMQNKIDTLLIQVKQKKNQNLTHAQKTNSICQQNKKLRGNIDTLNIKIQQKQNENKWMSSKVNQLKQALQYFKSNGNTRIQKLQDQLVQIQIKKKDSYHDHLQQKQALQINLQQKQIIISQLKREIEIKNSVLNNANKQIQSIKTTLSQKQITSSNTFNILNTEISKLKQEIKQYQQKINEYMNIYKKYEISTQTHDQHIQQKNKIIQALAKNVSQGNNQIQSLKRQKSAMEKLKNQHESKIQEQQNRINKLNEQVNDLKQQIQDLYRKRLQKQKQLSETINNNKKQASKFTQIQQQRDNLQKQLQRYKNIYTTISQQKRTKDIQLYDLRKESTQIKQEKQKKNKQRDQAKKILQLKDNSYQTLNKQHQNIKKQLLQFKYKSQCQTRDIQAKEKAIQQNSAKIRSLQQQISKLSSALIQKEQQLQKFRQISNNQKKNQKVNSSLPTTTIVPPTSPTNSTNSTNTYTQLQMRLCSLLGIYLTSNVDKILSPIQQIIKTKKSQQGNAKNYEQLLRIFDMKQSSTRLVSEMRLYKNNYTKLLDINQRQENDIVRLKQQNNFLIDRTQYGGTTLKKLQIMLQDSNERVIKLSLRNFNQKFTQTGTKKY